MTAEASTPTVVTRSGTDRRAETPASLELADLIAWAERRQIDLAKEGADLALIDPFEAASLLAKSSAFGEIVARAGNRVAVLTGGV